MIITIVVINETHHVANTLQWIQLQVSVSAELRYTQAILLCYKLTSLITSLNTSMVRLEWLYYPASQGSSILAH